MLLGHDVTFISKFCHHSLSKTQPSIPVSWCCWFKNINKKKLACQQLNFLYHNKSIPLGRMREQEFFSCLHNNGVMNRKNIHLAWVSVTEFLSKNEALLSHLLCTAMVPRDGWWIHRLLYSMSLFALNSNTLFKCQKLHWELSFP